MKKGLYEDTRNRIEEVKGRHFIVFATDKDDPKRFIVLLNNYLNKTTLFLRLFWSKLGAEEHGMEEYVFVQPKGAGWRGY